MGMSESDIVSQLDSDDESIKGLEIDDESRFEDKKFKTNYLRDCLECDYFIFISMIITSCLISYLFHNFIPVFVDLRYSESKPDAWKRHKYGLVNGPL